MTASAITSLSGTVAMGILCVAMALALLRLLLGPTPADRIVALDVVSFLAVGLIALVAFETRSYAFLDAAAIPALIGFIATAALARFLENGWGNP